MSSPYSYSNYRDETLEHIAKKSKTAAQQQSGYNNESSSKRPVAEWRITELLEHNLKISLEEQKQQQQGSSFAAATTKNAGGGDASSKTRTVQRRRPMQGDVASLALREEVFMGVRVGWPFPAMMRPQRQMCLHIIRALSASRHVVLESPTGTGKSAAILCSVLAWQRFHQQQQQQQQHGGSISGEEKVKIIYCSRTHSQVAQMVASLQKTPYRPAMAVLGSRDRMCIHRAVVGGDERGKPQQRGGNVNNECRVRVKATEGQRKWRLQSEGHNYSDENPPTHWDSDDLKAPLQQQQQQDDDGGSEPQEQAQQQQQQQQSNRFVKPTCPHYRQLGAPRTAQLMIQNFRPSGRVVLEDEKDGDGEHTKDGTHDIEDLVAFGKNPYQPQLKRQRIVVLRKHSAQDSWGLSLTKPTARTLYPRVRQIAAQSRAATSRKLRVGDYVYEFNGRSTARRQLDELAREMRACTDRLTLRVGSSSSLDGGDGDDSNNSNNNDGDDDEAEEEFVSPHSSCPYYTSRALERHAELVFAPYNYLLDPGIRQALKIDLENTVVVIDEAHNAEDVLRGGGSGKWGCIDLCNIIAHLQYYANSDRTGISSLSRNGGEEKLPLREVAHALLLFLERIVLFLMDETQKFEQHGGAQRALEEWERYKTPDTQSFELTYDGPSGHGVNGKAVGCKPFFDRLEILPTQREQLCKYAEEMNQYVSEGEGYDATLRRAAFETMVDFINKITLAAEQPQDFFVQSVAQANGGFAFAAGAAGGTLVAQYGQQPRKPRSMPYGPNRKRSNPDAEVDACYFCREVHSGHPLVCFHGKIRHGSYNNGATPPWESYLVLDLLSPARFMNDLTRTCRSVILASGSLAPLPSLCAELGLVGASTAVLPPDVAAAVKDCVDKKQKALLMPRLQDRPPPLEADHVVNLDKQLLAVAVGITSTGERLTVNYNQYKHDAFMSKMGDAIATIIESIPRGGVLVFLPSYALLKRCTRSWKPQYGRYSQFDNDSDVWDRLLASKGKVIVETSGSQEEFEKARKEYADTIRTTGNCILLAVFRGKMSEGISFNDDNARGVICVGIPFPSSFDRSTKAKKSYNDEQRKLSKRTDLLSGSSWYSQAAYRAVSQALGRCIRHAGDFGTVVLLDSRYCDEAPPDQYGVCIAHRNLPSWMRAHVKSLTTKAVHDPQSKLIGGGWKGLQTTMKRFFDEAPGFAAEVLQKQKESLAEAQRRRSVASAPESTTTKPSGMENVAVSNSLLKLSPAINLKTPSSDESVGLTPTTASTESSNDTNICKSEKW